MKDKQIKKAIADAIMHQEVIEEIPNPDQIVGSKKKRQYVLFEIKKNNDYALVGKFESSMKPNKLLKEFFLYIKWKQEEKIRKLFDKAGFGL